MHRRHGITNNGRLCRDIRVLGSSRTYARAHPYVVCIIGPIVDRGKFTEGVEGAAAV